MMNTKTIHATCYGCMNKTVIRLNSKEEETYFLLMLDCARCDYADLYDHDDHATFKPRLHRLLNEDSVFESQA